jgi:hypothetical protein
MRKPKPNEKRKPNAVGASTWAGGCQPKREHVLFNGHGYGTLRTSWETAHVFKVERAKATWDFYE